MNIMYVDVLSPVPLWLRSSRVMDKRVTHALLVGLLCPCLYKLQFPSGMFAFSSVRSRTDTEGNVLKAKSFHYDIIPVLIYLNMEVRCYAKDA
jgi:hypothetical protein